MISVSMAVLIYYDTLQLLLNTMYSGFSYCPCEKVELISPNLMLENVT